jgi:hypothetical protein
MADTSKTFVVWPQGPARLQQQFLHHFNNLRPTIKLTMEVEANNTLLSLDVLVMDRGPELAMKVYRKPTHVGRYLHFNSNRTRHVKTGVVLSFIGRANVICQDQKDFNKEIRNLIHDLMLNEYSQEFDNSIMKPPRSNRPSSDKICQGTLIIP